MPGFKEEAKAMQDQLVQWRRWCHQHPGIGFEVQETADFIANQLKTWDVEVETGVGRTGVVAIVRGAKPGPARAVRVDIDALPLQEENSHDYVSAYPGKMHACGHDGHIAMGLGVAKMLSMHKQDLAGSVIIIFQPAEEGQGGAREMIRDGVLARHKVEAIVAGHIGLLSTELGAGQVGISFGPLMAAAHSFEAEILGRGGHGALPNDTVDPVAISAEVICAWQRIVSREISPLMPAVLTVGQIHGGFAHNIIPEKVSLGGTLRYFHRPAGETLLKRIEEVLAGICATWKARYTFRVDEGYPALINNREYTEFFEEIAKSIAGEENVKVLEFPTTGSEDMACFLEKVPGTFFFLGAGNPAKGIVHPHHHPRFDIDEDILWLGAALLAQTSWEYQNK